MYAILRFWEYGGDYKKESRTIVEVIQDNKTGGILIFDELEKADKFTNEMEENAQGNFTYRVISIEPVHE